MSLPRGVHRSPVLSRQGRPYLVAVDYRGWLVDYAEVEPQEMESVTAHLWQVLDAADPEHARRESPRAPGNTLQAVTLAALGLLAG